MGMETQIRFEAFRCAAYLAIHGSSLRDCVVDLVGQTGMLSFLLRPGWVLLAFYRGFVEFNVGRC
jgi:hypothetical protein